MILRWRLLLHAVRALNGLRSHLAQSPISFWISPMTYLGHSLEVNSILIHSMAELPLAENGELGESFFFFFFWLMLCFAQLAYQ